MLLLLLLDKIWDNGNNHESNRSTVNRQMLQFRLIHHYIIIYSDLKWPFNFLAFTKYWGIAEQSRSTAVV